MSRVSLLQYLIMEVMVRDIEKGIFPFYPDQTTLDDLEERYSASLEALDMKETDWEFILDELERWYEQKQEEDPSHKVYLQREDLWEEMVGRCEELPSYYQVAEKLGTVTAETYLMDVENIECMPDPPPIGIEADFSRNKTRKIFSKNEMEEITALVSILALGSRDESIDDYERRKEYLSQDKRARRGRIRQQNEPFIERAQSLQIWFPYPGQLDRWHRDARTAPFYPLFVEMLQRVRVKLKDEHGVLQYIPKRRLTAKTAAGLPRNMENMGRYLME